MDKDSCKTDQLAELSNFGVSWQTWKNWTYIQNDRDYPILSSLEKNELIKNYEENKRKNQIFSSMTCIQNFYKSDTYRNRINYIDMLNTNNYWFWREHFYKIFSYDYMYRDEDRSNENGRWWRRQLNEEHQLYYSDSDDDDLDELEPTFASLHPDLEGNDDEEEDDDDDDDDEEDDDDSSDDDHDDEEKQMESLDDTPTPM